MAAFSMNLRKFNPVDRCNLPSDSAIAFKGG
jgi:hypothetical protein